LTSTLELLAGIHRGQGRRLGLQIEEQIRRAIRSGTLRAGARVPSTRDLARQLGVSRPIVVDAYEQLAAEGYLAITQGARPRVAATPIAASSPAKADSRAEPPPRIDFTPAVPDLAAFPRTVWLRATREALATMTDDDLGYREPHGCDALRRALAEYLGRARGVLADPARIIVTSGFAQGRTLLCRALRASGAKRIAVEDPSYSEWEPIRHAGLEILPIPVDEDGIRVDVLARTNADAVMVTPAHQAPTGVVLSGERRTALLAWLRARRAVALEDDYDAEFRYDRSPVGALQGMEPEHVVYAGTASKTLSPALRLGWLVVPRHLQNAVQAAQIVADFGVSRIEQHALAWFLANGELDRHLRRMRARYRARRDTLLRALAAELPEATVHGIAAGLHATVRLPKRYDERAIYDEARRQGIAIGVLGDYRIRPRRTLPTILLGYARCAEPTIEAGVRDLARVIRKA
jgi:GntR family transcriptional regulator/MocR family aminotransferase